jgi:hypothetical protein
MPTTVSVVEIRNLIQILEKRNVSRKRFVSLLENGVFDSVFDSKADIGDGNMLRAALGLKEIIPDEPVPVSPPDILRFSVDYRQSFQEMLDTVYFDWNDYSASKVLPLLDGTGVVEFESCLFHFNRFLLAEEIKKSIQSADKEHPWMPGKIEHILAFSSSFSDSIYEFPIVGLGSPVFRGDLRVPSLKTFPLRELHLVWLSGKWSPVTRFFAVRKVSA